MGKFERLREALTELGWSQAELARRLGLDAHTVGAWARGGVPRYAVAYVELALAVRRCGLLVEKGG